MAIPPWPAGQRGSGGDSGQRWPVPPPVIMPAPTALPPAVLPPTALPPTAPYQAPGRVHGYSQQPQPGPRRSRRPFLAGIVALLAVTGLVFSGIGIAGQFMPRQFTPAQRSSIESWEVGSRWRSTQKTKIFPARVGYALNGGPLGLPGSLRLTARRLGIARQATCAKAAGVTASAMSVLRHDGCQAVLRATYTDATSSLVLTVGVAVLGNQDRAQSAARYLTGQAAEGQGAIARHLLLKPVQVPGTPAAAFGVRQRQLAWVVGSGSYLVLATAGFADGRPRVSVASDSYTLMEMTSLARGVAVQIAGPLGVPPTVPRCPGGPAC